MHARVFTAKNTASLIRLTFFLTILFILMLGSTIVSADPVVIAEIPVGVSPIGVGVNPTTNRVYVADANVDVSQNVVTVIDGATNTIITTIPVGLDVEGLGVNPVTNRIYVANDADNLVTVIDGAANAVIATVPGGQRPFEVAVNPATNRIYVTNLDDNIITVIDGTSNTVLTNVEVGFNPRAIAVNTTTNRIYVTLPESNIVSVIDGTSNTILGIVSVDLFPAGVAVNPDTNRIYVSSVDGGRVSVIDGATNTVIDDVIVGSTNVGITVNPTTNRVYVANVIGMIVTVIDGATNTVVANVPIGQNLGFIAANPNTNRIYAPGGDIVAVIEDNLEPGTVNLTLTKTASPFTVRIGENLTFPLTVANVGTAPATGVELVDPLLAGVTFASVDQAACAHAGGIVTCDVGTLNAGASFAVNIVVTGSVAGNYTNTATVSSNEPDSDPGNNSASIDIGVTANGMPDAIDDEFTMLQDTALTLSPADLLSNDFDPDGDTLTVIASTPFIVGTSVVNPDGTGTYTPPAGFVGTVTATYTISDGNGGTDTATISIIVNAVEPPPNNAPDAVDDVFTMEQGTSLTLSLVDILSNDSDPDGDPLTIVASTLFTVGISVVNPDGTGTYTPPADFAGTVTATYTISDGNGGTDTATISIIVNAVEPPPNNAPDAVDDEFTMEQGTSLTLNMGDALANDTDPDGDPLTVTDATPLTPGDTTLNLDGTATYTPPEDFVGDVSSSYTISDGRGGTDTATITIHVVEADS
jgi:uncharacterized repeat protein (TIGR01451 family)